MRHREVKFLAQGIFPIDIIDLAHCKHSVSVILAIKTCLALF